ncbi:MAG: hypothetical protein HC804_01030 [Anaerolineae bacterium]|nr:hypothetical protein [Anaerolineae bacterium]
MNHLDTYDSSIDRPGCVTVYALLAWLGATSYICGALFLAAISLSDPDAAFGLIFA